MEIFKTYNTMRVLKQDYNNKGELKWTTVPFSTPLRIYQIKQSTTKSESNRYY